MTLFYYICHDCIVPFSWIKFHCVYCHIFLFYLCVDGHLVWMLPWIMLTSTVISVGIQVTPKHIDLESFSYKLRDDTAGWCSSYIFRFFLLFFFWGNFILTFTVDELVYILTSRIQGFIISPYPHLHFLNFLDNSHSEWSERESQSSINLHFSNDLGVEYFQIFVVILWTSLRTADPVL